MGGQESKSNSKTKPTTSTGVLGRGRHTQDYVNIRVGEINGRAIGKEIIRRCGTEGQHPYLDEEGRATLRFLRAANSFIPDVEDDGANLRNTAFILRQPGRQFVIIAGDGDWEYDFCEDADGEIYGRCIRKPFLRFFWDKAKSAVVRILPLVVGSLVAKFLPGGSAQKALKY